ncbi:hypothetical protein BDR07DRAFT_425178 [Suillus spraguei]|nr:hypothetical protein BDR07DRAFT_425178 [Suillus spraguei]
MLGTLQVPQPQQNQGGQQQQGQLGQQQPQGQPGQPQGIPPPPPQNGQDFNLSSVLHFLQTEWRRYERDRNEWEIERAEMRLSKSTALQQQGAKDDVQSHKDGSSGSSPRSDDSPLPSERVPNGTSAPQARQPSWPGGANWSVGLPSVGSVGKPPPGRDPKSRARSRDY